jgi:hypothetical protein
MDIVDIGVICALHAQTMRKPDKNSLTGGGNTSATRTTPQKMYAVAGAKEIVCWRTRSVQPVPVPWRKVLSTVCSAMTLPVIR